MSRGGRKFRFVLATIAVGAAIVTPVAASSSKLPRPIAKCMSKAGLANILSQSAGVWNGEVRGTSWKVGVDGPFKTKARARAFVTGLAGTEDAARGGVWVVSAALRAHVRPLVLKVARCIQHAHGVG